MRVTLLSTHAAIQRQIQSASAQLFDAQVKVATQRQINKMSDDPVRAGEMLNVRTLIEQNTQFQRNLNFATSLSEIYDSTLAEVIDTISRAKQLMLSQANNISTSPLAREATRVEMVSLLGGVLTSSNVRFAGRFIFSGFRDDNPAFLGDFTTTTPNIGNLGGAAVTAESIFDSVAFTGDDYEIQFKDLGAGVTGFDVFNVTRGVFVSTNNTYVSGAEIRFNGVALTIADNTGPPDFADVFSVQSTDAGQYAGDNGDLQLELEQDRLQSINLAGDSVFQGVALPGGVDIFDLFNRAIQALRTDDTAEIQALIDDFDTGLEQITNFQSVAGSRQNLFGSISARLENLDISLKTVLSDIRDIDIAEALTTLSQRELAFEATLGAAARVIQPSLLDFLR